MRNSSIRLGSYWTDRGLTSAIRRFAGVATLVLAGSGLAAAQSGKTVWDGAYSDAQATRGMTAFAQSCAGCHALGAEGRAPLAGDAFWKSFAQKSVGELLEFISKYMPNGTPGSLNEATYNDITAVILKTNGFPAGSAELAKDNAAGFQIVQKNGSSELPANALARVVGCLAKSGSDWIITSATTPERAERASAEDATRPLGKGTMQLKFVISKLDPMIGSRVAVNGILMGTNGADGINVTTVTRVADKCQ